MIIADNNDVTIPKGGGSATGASLALETYNDAGNPARMRLRTSKHDTQGTHGAMTANLPLGYIQFEGSDGDSFERSAVISGWATQTWSDSNRGSRLEFYTTPNCSTSETLGMKIDNGQGIYIKCGSNSNLFLQATTVKSWGGMNGSGTKLGTTFNMASTAKNSTGNYTVTHTQAFSGTVGQVWVGGAESTGGYFLDFATPATGTVTYSVLSHAGSLTCVAHRLMGVGYQ